MRVALVSSDGRCGIAEHSNLLVQSVQQADPGIEFVRDAVWLNPTVVPHADAEILHLNYHRGLHSQWTPNMVKAERSHHKIVITFHDTYETQPDRLPWDLLDVCDAMIVHEPCDLSSGLTNHAVAKIFVEHYGDTAVGPKSPAWLNAAKVYYWRQGVPEPLGTIGLQHRQHTSRPIVGTCGFAFPWKGFELLCDAAARVGWGVLILSHNATDEQVADWQARNPWVDVRRDYAPTPWMIAQLQECDATAFLYSCANSGTSGAIRLGIAAGKPLLATQGCRQFRDLYPDGSIHWVHPEVSLVARELHHLLLLRFSSEIVALRERDSWRHLGKKYAALYRSLL